MKSLVIIPIKQKQKLEPGVLQQLASVTQLVCRGAGSPSLPNDCQLQYVKITLQLIVQLGYKFRPNDLTVFL